MDKDKYKLVRPVINGRRTDVWYVYWLDERRRPRRRSTRETDKLAAEEWLARFRVALEAPPDGVTVNWILDRYEEAKDDAKSIDRIKSHLRAVRKAFGASAAAGLASGGTDVCIRRWRNGGTSDGTIRTRLLLLRAALNWAEKMQLIERAPYIPAPPPGAPRERYLTREEFHKLYAAATEVHLRTFLAMGVYSGLRNGAMLSLTWDNIDRQAMLIKPTGGSANKKRAIVRINTPLALALGSAWESREGEYVIQWGGKPVKSMKRSFHTAVRRAELENVNIHDLRKTCASWLAMNGVSMDRIAIILGDSVAIVMKHYAHLSPDYLRDEMEGLA